MKLNQNATTLDLLLFLFISIIFCCSQSTPSGVISENSESGDNGIFNEDYNSEEMGLLNLSANFDYNLDNNRVFKNLLFEATNESSYEDIGNMDYELTFSISGGTGNVIKKTGKMSTLGFVNGEYKFNRSIILEKGSWDVQMNILDGTDKKFSSQSKQITITPGTVVQTSLLLSEAGTISYGDSTEYAEAKVNFSLDQYPYFDYVYMQNVNVNPDDPSAPTPFYANPTDCVNNSPFFVDFKVCNPGKKVSDMELKVKLTFSDSAQSYPIDHIISTTAMPSECEIGEADITSYVCDILTNNYNMNFDVHLYAIDTTESASNRSEASSTTVNIILTN